MVQKGADAASCRIARPRGQFGRCFDERIDDLGQLVLDGAEARRDELL